MAISDVEKAIEILGINEVAQTVKKQPGERTPKRARAELKGFVESRGEPKMWTELIRSRLPSASLKRTAGRLGVSVNELSKTLRLPARTVHRRVEKRQKLTSEETERNIRAARALARAQQLLGDENGRVWLLEPCRGLGNETPISLLDTSDGFVAVMDELGRLEYGVIT
jgi:putative toxin-antitoxin system antitoxin component (TIGR02293 family)